MVEALFGGLSEEKHCLRIVSVRMVRADQSPFSFQLGKTLERSFFHSDLRIIHAELFCKEVRTT